MTFKTLDDVIAESFYDLKKPEEPAGTYGLGAWRWGDTYQITTSVIASQKEGNHNFTKLAKPKSAKRLADSLASQFNHTNLVGWLPKQFKSCYDVDPDKDGKVIATYNLGNSSLFNCYDRTVTYEADKKTGDVTITYQCNKAVPEKVIAKDLYKLREALRERWKYFVENAEADDKKEKTLADAKTDVKTDAKAKDGKKAPAKKPTDAEVNYEGIPKEHLDIFKQNYEALKADAARVINYLKNPKQFYDEQIAPQLTAGSPT
jgi:hypothetical protein